MIVGGTREERNLIAGGIASTKNTQQLKLS